MIQLLKHTETKSVTAANGSCLPGFSLSSLGDSCATSGITGYSITIKFSTGTMCEVFCQGISMGYFASGMTTSCMPGEMVRVTKMGGSGACSGNSGYVLQP